MISNELAGAREYEIKAEALVPEDIRPVYHLSPRTGWLNDPNGFSFYGGKYHMFYQYHPYSSYWGPMHWGHAVSEDLLHWEYLPAAMAPDAVYDHAGCFSGSAVTLPDGRHLLMYTGCADDGLDPQGRWRQTQNIAISESGDPGVQGEYVKYAGNPVITSEALPEGGDPYEFRDPYLWQASDGSYRSLVANAGPAGEGTKLLVYRSEDALHWGYAKVLFEDSARIGIMWECPNFFPLGGRHVLIASPMDMQAEEADGSIRFPKGNNVCYMTGDYDEAADDFTPDRRENGRVRYDPVDCGLDFYAPQVMLTPDGRRVMTGWMQDPKTANLHEDTLSIFGQMTIPRELSLEDGRLIQRPVRELESLRTDEVRYTDVTVTSEETGLEGIRGRVLDLELDIRPDGSDGSESGFSEFTVSFAKKDQYCTKLIYRPDQSVVTIDRSRSGQQKTITGKRTIRVRGLNGHIRIRILLDRWSAEIFVNDGEQVLSVTYYTDPDAQDITFSAGGRALMDVTMHRFGRI